MLYVVLIFYILSLNPHAKCGFYHLQIVYVKIGALSEGGVLGALQFKID